MAGRLKQLDEIARGVFQQDLRSSRPGYDVVAKLHAGGTQPRNLGRKILLDEVNAIPAARTGAFAVPKEVLFVLAGSLPAANSDN